MERTYIMLKPDAIKRGLMGEVIARIESGVRKCSIEFLIKIANALGTSTDALLIDCLNINAISSAENQMHMMLIECTNEELTILTRNFACLREILKDFTIN